MSLRLPWVLVWLRIALAPAILAIAAWWPEPGAFAACLALALLSDYFDGAIARHQGTATAGLRRFDSFADTLFCLAALGAVWLRHPAVVKAESALLVTLLAVEIARYVLDFLKFGREASYHMWSAKLWALALFLAFFMLLVAEQSGAWVTAAIGFGILSDLEGFAISLVLPVWCHDVLSLVHAWRFRASRAAG